MLNLQDIQEKIFNETKEILHKISESSNPEELVAHQNLITELGDRISFLKILDKNKDLLTQKKELEPIDSQELNLKLSHFQKMEDEANNFAYQEQGKLGNQNIEEEESNQFHEELNEKLIEEEARPNKNEILYAENLKKEINNEQITNENDSKNLVEEPFEAENFKKNTFEENKNEEERDFSELEERRRKIVEYNKEDIIHPTKNETNFDENASLSAERKFKLSNIKGLKSVQSLFDDDPLEKIMEDEKPIKKVEGTLLKTNISTDFMEAEKQKPDFKIDLNDKIAFSKTLFGGSQAELNETINRLNQLKSMNEAKEFLSELYYQKNWKNADEQAQRLWNLVENKFL